MMVQQQPQQEEVTVLGQDLELRRDSHSCKASFTDAVRCVSYVTRVYVSVRDAVAASVLHLPVMGRENTSGRQTAYASSA
jgi:hypothetical protein